MDDGPPAFHFRDVNSSISSDSDDGLTTEERTRVEQEKTKLAAKQKWDETHPSAGPSRSSSLTGSVATASVVASAAASAAPSRSPSVVSKAAALLTNSPSVVLPKSPSVTSQAPSPSRSPSITSPAFPAKAGGLDKLLPSRETSPPEAEVDDNDDVISKDLRNDLSRELSELTNERSNDDRSNEHLDDSRNDGQESLNGSSRSGLDNSDSRAAPGIQLAAGGQSKSASSVLLSRSRTKTGRTLDPGASAATLTSSQLFEKGNQRLGVNQESTGTLTSSQLFEKANRQGMTRIVSNTEMHPSSSQLYALSTAPAPGSTKKQAKPKAAPPRAPAPAAAPKFPFRKREGPFGGDVLLRRAKLPLHFPPPPPRPKRETPPPPPPVHTDFLKRSGARKVPRIQRLRGAPVSVQTTDIIVDPRYVEPYRPMGGHHGVVPVTTEEGDVCFQNMYAPVRALHRPHWDLRAERAASAAGFVSPPPRSRSPSPARRSPTRSPSPLLVVTRPGSAPPTEPQPVATFGDQVSMVELMMEKANRIRLERRELEDKIRIRPVPKEGSLLAATPRAYVWRDNSWGVGAAQLHSRPRYWQ